MDRPVDTMMDGSVQGHRDPPHRFGHGQVDQCLAYMTSPTVLGVTRDHELAVTSVHVHSEHASTNGFRVPKV